MATRHPVVEQPHWLKGSDATIRLWRWTADNAQMMEGISQQASLTSATSTAIVNGLPHLCQVRPISSHCFTIKPNNHLSLLLYEHSVTLALLLEHVDD
jgi:hypothetical protein